MLHFHLLNFKEIKYLTQIVLTIVINEYIQNDEYRYRKSCSLTKMLEPKK